MRTSSLILVFAVSFCGAAIFVSQDGDEQRGTYEFYDETEYSFTMTVTATASPTSTVTSTPTPIINRSSLVLASTAYTNNEGKRTGVNGDVYFHLIIGQLVGRSPESAGKTEGLVRIMSFGIGGDLKYSFFDQGVFYPALAVGSTLGFFVDIGEGGGGSEINVSDEKTFFVRDFYTCVSRSLGPVNLHAGYRRGGFPRLITLYSSSLRETTLIDGEELEAGLPKNTYYAGFDLPLGSVRRFRVEGFVVPGMYREPVLINTCIDGFVNFNLAYLYYYEEDLEQKKCYSLLGYFNQRFTIYGR